MTPAWGVALYLVLGVAWVVVGDLLLERWVGGSPQLGRWHALKGWGFMLLTALLAWWLLERMRRAEKQRWGLARELARIARDAPAGMARVDPAAHFRIVWANELLCEWTGLSVEELRHRRFRELVVPKDADLAAHQLEDLLAGRVDHYQGERLCLHAAGRPPLPVLCNVRAVPASGDEPAHLVCVLQDIGEISAARAALAQTQDILALALAGSGSGLWDWDLRTRRATYSPGLLRLLGEHGIEAHGSAPLLARLHPEDRERVECALKRAIHSGQVFDESARLQRLDGSWCWFHARGQRHLDAQGEPERLSGILTDLTERRAAEERQRLASAVVENTVEGVVVAGADARILSVNPAFTRILGYTEEELRGLNPRVFKSGRHDKAFYEAMWECVLREGHWRGEIWNRRKNGEVFPERMSLSVVRDAQGKVTHYVCIFTDISEERARQAELEHLAHHDPLTGLSNRLHFGQQLAALVQEAQGSGEQLAVLLLNLDRFKDVNGSYGHAVGDQVLRHITNQVRAALRPGDLIGRLAGDEIAVVARHLRHADGAAAVARSLIAAVGQPWHTPEGIAVVVGVSVGICMYPSQADTAQLLLQGAHAAVYGAKALGRGVYCFYSEEMTQGARERLEMEARLRAALAQGHLQLFYQPQVEIASGRIVGAEALVRWLDPDEGLIPPARFIPVAEMSGVIGALGQWVMREACRQGQQWRAAGLPELRIAVNVSPREFHLTDVAACAAQALQDSGFPARCLELELTEGALAERPEEARQTLLRLQEVGVHIAVDDFGTGYSSLAHLKRFPIDVLKIDQGFTRDVPHSADDMAISAAIIAMGQRLGLRVLAEGVETAQQLQFLREHGCDLYQGYLCSRPLPAQEFEALLRAGPPEAPPLPGGDFRALAALLPRAG
ncbi:sensor domain-containing protein [Melaminivora alkalimesophila]|uniref:PAS domain S-box-containing protein/diguanylate cyclase (GGDEF)-like protein n=1 Tax=Melaminivora alkalimesophila TaxID=1165852 RepID=A0A317R8Q2_9BURK|nr:EAL domain-containing protein [Melaminivora alkalimesophila]PWW44379.1 PAS domain S-box-containing protein/diguanylate cyclase (GGDEF)-like protein [Melaminivora alkalimesophila]